MFGFKKGRPLAALIALVMLLTLLPLFGGVAGAVQQPPLSEAEQSLAATAATEADATPGQEATPTPQTTPTGEETSTASPQATLDAADADATRGDTVALTVVDARNKATKTFTLAELQAIATEEGDKTYNYSGYNTMPNLKSALNAKGPTLEGILQKAGIFISGIDRSALIKVEASDGYNMQFTCSDMFGDTRYYFPNGGNGTANGIYNAAAEEGKVVAPTIINLEKDNGTLCIGQVAPHEQTYNAFVQSMVNGGTVTITTGIASQWTAVSVVEDAVAGGTTIKITSPDANSESKIYYELATSQESAKEPSEKSNIYNYQASRWGGATQQIDLPKKSYITLKVMNIGGLDSKMAMFTRLESGEIVPVTLTPTPTPGTSATPTKSPTATATKTPSATASSGKAPVTGDDTVPIALYICLGVIALLGVGYGIWNYRRGSAR